tara:strand:- start:1429 stop:1791 length:363 start_codon:yes stop_codon:yes gene_type:complete
MASNRYDSSDVVKNNHKMYKKYLEETRGLSRGIAQLKTQSFRYPTVREISTLSLTTHIWKVGDRYSKLAHEHYADVEMWWVIAMFNRSPTEAFLKKGDLIYIPKPLERVIELFTIDEKIV